MKFPVRAKRSEIQQVSTYYSILKEAYSDNWINVKITFGDPRKQCTGAGVCQVLAPVAHHAECCRGVTVGAYIQMVNHQYLTLIFDKKNLSLTQRKQYFLQARMQLHTDLLLPNDLGLVLTPLHRIIACKGAYTIYQNEQYYHFFVRYRLTG